ncbi:MAG: serine hydroxymethyltransferase [Candidatus Brockarchaeota archaeon]|nr:serine hydroxymethyltransferase [Candidatus Brockarchaeota archaeon]MBO3809861.1 serine hydroxymethyltransferase [Candidatus Brockarchaeota archaeon]
MSEKSLAEEVFEIVREHHAFRSSSLNLIASENITSRGVRRLLTCDMGHRYAVGFLYERMYRGCEYIDKLEELTHFLARKLFRVEHVNTLPVSGTVANIVAIGAFTRPGDTMMGLSVMDGGHSSFREVSRYHGVSMVPLPFNAEEYNIDVEQSRKMIAKVMPKMVMLGASELLFPQPVKEVSEAASNVGATVVYDAAHVLGLVAGGCFQDPLREGAAAVTGSTHKTFFGPQGGIILCKRQYGEDIDRVALSMINNHHINRVAALAYTLAEFLAFGQDYSRMVVSNAQALAEALYNNGVDVICSDRGFTKSHQVIFRVKEGTALEVSKNLEKANIITSMTPLPTDKSETTASGIRLGVQEVTRLGMGRDEMALIGSLIARVVKSPDSARAVKEEVKDLAGRFRSIHYTFSDGEPAYEWD